MKYIGSAALTLISILFCAASASAQQPLSESVARPVVVDPVAVSLDYKVGPGDLLSVSVTGVKEFDQSLPVSNSGRVHVPYVGVMFVAGMTAAEIEREVTRLIQERQLVKEPLVRVQVVRHRAQPTYVIGEVGSPGQFVITKEMYLLDLVGKAGGLLPSAAKTGLLYRRRTAAPSIQTKILIGPAPPAAETTAAASSDAASETKPEGDVADEEVIRIDLEVLRDGTRPEMNVKVRGGDILYVPRRQQQNFFVIGDVKIPGAYGLPMGLKVSAAQAVIFAGGTLRTAKSGNGFLMRHDAEGNRQAIPVDFREILAGKKPDIPVQADDIIFIPSSAAKTVALGLLDMLPNLVQQFLIF